MEHRWLGLVGEPLSDNAHQRVGLIFGIQMDA